SFTCAYRIHRNFQRTPLKAFTQTLRWKRHPCDTKLAQIYSLADIQLEVWPWGYVTCFAERAKIHDTEV
ncbi:MAG TPA: hypothetical protein VIX17_18875, partial [Pyrinomonadaceae bacterium]